MNRVERMEFDIDTRLLNIWAEANEIQEWTIEAVAAFMRAAYGQGYIDALREEGRGERARLCVEHGYRIP